MSHNLDAHSPDLGAPKGRVIGGEVAVGDAEIALQLDGIARSQRHHGLQPDRDGERDMGGRSFAEGAADFGRAVQYEPPPHARRRAGVDLVEQRYAEEVGAIDRGHEPVVRGVESALIVVVFVVQADLCLGRVDKRDSRGVSGAIMGRPAPLEAIG